VHTAESLLHMFDESTNSTGVAHIDALGQNLDLELLKLLLDLRRRLRDRAARKVEPIEGDVRATTCKLDRDVSANASSSTADHYRATAQAAEMSCRLRLRLLTKLLEQSLDGTTRALGCAVYPMAVVEVFWIHRSGLPVHLWGYAGNIDP
jgi:ubiquinone biosynthesis protein UbiJ